MIIKNPQENICRCAELLENPLRRQPIERILSQEISYKLIAIETYDLNPDTLAFEKVSESLNAEIELCIIINPQMVYLATTLDCDEPRDLLVTDEHAEAVIQLLKPIFSAELVALQSLIDMFEQDES